MHGGRIRNIQALRAVAALLVVARHLQIYVERAVGGSPWLGRFHAGDMGVDLFFVISGFILVVNHGEPFTGAGDAARFLYRRAARIYPLYWLYSLPALAIYLWRPQWLHRLDFGMPVLLVRSFLLWPQPGWPLLGQAWSLVYEVYFYLVFAGLRFLPGKHFRRGLLAWAGMVAVGGFLLSARPALDRPESALVFSALTLEFIAGALVALALRHVPAARAATPGWLALGLATFWMAWVVLPLGPPLSGVDRVVDYGLPCVAGVGGAVLLESAGWRAAGFLATVGEWSYSIYLSHIFVIAAFVHLLPPGGLPGRWAEAGLETGLAAAVLLAGAGSYRWLEVPLSRLTRRERSAAAGNRPWRRTAMPATLPAADQASP